LVLIIFTVAPAMPFTVVFIVLLADVLDTVFTMGTAVPVTPLTVVVKLLGAVLVLLTVVVATEVAAGSHFAVAVL
jgi:hypothetical protein